MKIIQGIRLVLQGKVSIKCQNVQQSKNMDIVVREYINAD